MKQSAWIWNVVTLMVVLVVAPAAMAQEDDARQHLQKARALFEKQEYGAAQETFRAIDRDKLSEDEQTEFDRLKEILPQAIAASAAAEQAWAKAERAFAEDRWDEADAMYQAVLKNEFAKKALKSQATKRRERVAEQKRMAQAVEPTGVLEAQPAEPGAAPPEQPPARAPALPASRRLTPIQEMQQRDTLLWQKAVAQAQALSAQAHEAIAQRDFTQARHLAELALQKIEAARGYAEPVSKYLTAKEAAERLKLEVADAEKAYQEKRAEQKRREIAERIAQRRKLLEQQRREKVEQLFNTASQLRKQQRFTEAAEVLRQILYIDPGRAKARHQLEMAEDYASLLVQREWAGDLHRQQRSALIKAEEALIPWDYEVLYPKNWLELTAKRSAAGIGLGGWAEDSELNRKLDEILPEFQFEEAPFEAVIEHLQEIQEINIAVDWDDLEANMIERDKTVTIQLRGLPFRTVLREVLTQVGADTPLAFAVSEGLLRIATKDKLDRDKHVLVYDIRDLLLDVPNFTNAAQLDPAQALGQAGGAGGRGGSGGSQLFQTTQQDRGDERTGAAGVDMIERILEIIRQTVEPDSWQETGAGDGSIRELNGQLIIYNTSDAHGRIRGLLDQLRATRALQIALEARFLSVTSNFLEEFGVDLDFVFNSGSAGFDQAFSAGVPAVDPFSGASILIPRPYSRIGATPATPGFGTPLTQGGFSQPYGQAGVVPSGTGISPHFRQMTPIRAAQGTLPLVDPSGLSTGVPGSFAQRVTQPALSIAGSFLDNLQVDFLIRATQANQRSSVVQAPRLVMFNGQRANLSIGRFRGYVSSVQPQIGEQAVAVQPIIGQASSGTVLDVTGTISADRRYVSVIVQTTQTDPPAFERFEVQRPSGNSPGIFILLPEQAFTTVNTTVSIPDGGTILLGGVKQVGEVEVEAGVPILSKIPIIKRAFTNKTMVKDTHTLLILMKAKIIIQQEAEEDAFPAFSSLSGS